MAQADVRRIAEILRILKRTYLDAECSLVHRDPFQLLAATILSAQCTDERVNLVTPALFKKFGTPERMAIASLKEIEKLIHSTGFYKNKAISLKESARAIVEEHGGKVPMMLEELVKLRGVGRKTANVILGVAYGVPGLVVDTHVGRISRRMGFTKSQDPVKVEHELMNVVPREDWVAYGHLLISHGRTICTARKAYCEKCPISHLCPKVGVPR